MDTQTLQTLDYYRIRDSIAFFCASEEGKERLLCREPSADDDEITNNKQLAQEWTRCALTPKPAILQNWPPIAQLLPALLVDGAALETEDIFALWRLCGAVSSVRNSIRPLENELHIPLLAQRVREIPALEVPEAEISKIIDQNGQIRDLPEIRAIKQSITRIRKDIETLMRSYTADSAFKDALQSDLPTIRGDRQVLAVKVHFKGRIRGIVHEVSQTGQTVYIEPADVVQRNNDLVQEEHRLSLEIRRILRELTARLGTSHTDFAAALEQMTELDCAYAIARWGIEHRCVFAIRSQTLSLFQARHPLLGAAAVPIDLAFLPERRILIITGANTGGKTVSLKTAALFAALNQSGFPVPAAEGTALPLFDNIFADIGDEQSIDQSLSTFSGHMKNIARITTQTTEHSLVLLDELGSGTDPQEGGAIAMAVLDFLLEKGSLVLVTTHHGILKNYGYTHPACANASVDFDEMTLSPTYRIVMGVPGESHALEIARRNGLLPNIADAAKSYLVNEQADVSALIKGLTAKHEELDGLERTQRQNERIIAEKRRKVDLQELRIKQKELELREQGCSKLNAFFTESRKMLENLVRELREGEITREKTLKVKDFIAQLDRNIAVEKQFLEEERAKEKKLREHIESEEQLRSALSARTDSRKSKSARTRVPDFSQNTRQTKVEYASEFASGVDVFLPGKRQGQLVRRDKKGNWIVQTGNIKLTVKEQDLEFAPTQKVSASISIEMAQPDPISAAESESQRGTAAGLPTQTPVLELRLLGMRLDEALKTLERQLDLAQLKGLMEFSVIHGKGNGILQQGVHEYLKNAPGIAAFAFARPENGGSGKTCVKLK